MFYVILNDYNLKHNSVLSEITVCIKTNLKIINLKVPLSIYGILYTRLYVPTFGLYKYVRDILI